MKRRLTRRRFLRGLGGTAIALPLLGDGLGQLAHSQASGSMGTGPFPKRFIYLFRPNGTIPDAFWPVAGTTETDFVLDGSRRDADSPFFDRSILSPLAQHKDKLILPRGIDMKSGSSAAGPGEPHQRGMGALLTGTPLQEGNFVGNDGTLAGWGDGISIDQLIAQHVGIDTRFGSIQLGVRADSSAASATVSTRISYSAAAQPLPPINEPRAVFDQLFSDSESAPGSTERTRELRRSILDVVGAQFHNLQNSVGHHDKIRLERHLAEVRDLERRLENTQISGEACYAPDRPGVYDPEDETTMPALTQLQIDLLVTAMSCDLTRVGSIQFSNAWNHIRFPWLDSLGDGHTLSHSGNGAAAAREELVSRDHWFAEQFAYLLKKLDDVPEGDGTMLDNTVVLWVNELSVGNIHSNDSMPFLLAGSAGGALRTGRLIQYENASHNDLLLSLAHAFGVERETFGDPRYCNGPLSGLSA